MTQYQRILTIMAREPNRWFYPHDFMKPDLGSLFVGYKASSRVSELAKSHPQIFDSKQDGKYTVRKLKMDSIDAWYYTLPNSLKKCLRIEGLEPKRTPEDQLSGLGLRFADE